MCVSLERMYHRGLHLFSFSYLWLEQRCVRIICSRVCHHVIYIANLKRTRKSIYFLKTGGKPICNLTFKLLIAEFLK